jgi:hypothetical protein
VQREVHRDTYSTGNSKEQRAEVFQWYKEPPSEIMNPLGCLRKISYKTPMLCRLQTAVVEFLQPTNLIGFDVQKCSSSSFHFRTSQDQQKVMDLLIRDGQLTLS